MSDQCERQAAKDAKEDAKMEWSAVVILNEVKDLAAIVRSFAALRMTRSPLFFPLGVFLGAVGVLALTPASAS